MYICRIYISYIYTYVYSARPNQWFMFPYWWIDFRKVFYLSFSTNMSNPVPGIFFSRIWSSAEYHVVLVLLLNLVGFFISTQPKWSGGNVLYHWGTSSEGTSGGGPALDYFWWFIWSLWTLWIVSPYGGLLWLPMCQCLLCMFIHLCWSVSITPDTDTHRDTWTHPHAHTQTQIHPCTHTHTHTHAHAHTYTYSLFLPLSLTHTQTHTHSLSLSHTDTNTRTHTHTY